MIQKTEKVLSNLFFWLYHSCSNGLFMFLKFLLKWHSKMENRVHSTPEFLQNCYHMYSIFYHHVDGNKRNNGWEQKVETIFYINIYNLQTH